MFIGEYIHTIDEKGRAIFPSKFRKQIEGEFVITRGFDNCLSIYDMNEWTKLDDKVKKLPQVKANMFRRFIFSGAAMLEADKQGRILIPQALRDYAFLEKDIVFIGISTNIEVWNKSRWDTVSAEMTPEMVANSLDQLDF